MNEYIYTNDFQLKAKMTSNIGNGITMTPFGQNFYHNDLSTSAAISELEKVVGRLPDRLKYDYTEQQSRTHGDLTELLKSRVSPVITNQVTGLLLKTYISAITNYLLPIRQLGPLESINIRWNEISFDNGIAPEIENEGLARLYTHNKSRRGARMVRRGVAVEVQEGFYLTPEGRNEFAMQIEQLATIIQRTNEYDAMVTLLQTPLRDHLHANEMNGPYNHIYGARHGMNPYDRLMLQRDWFSIVNKAVDSRGFSNLITNLRTTMVKNGVTPDAIIVPPNLVSHYYGSSEDLWNYSSAGPSNSQNRSMAEDVGPENGIRLQTFQGLKVVDTYVQRMTNGGGEEAGDLLTVPVQIGEYYPMRTADVLVDKSVLTRYNSKMRNVRIFNEDQGRFVTVLYEDAIKNSLRWDEAGYLLQDAHLNAGEDMFLFLDEDNTKRVTDYWFHVDKKWLSNESAKNVVDSVLSKFSVGERTSFNEAITNYSDACAVVKSDGSPVTDGDQAVYRPGRLVRNNGELPEDFERREVLHTMNTYRNVIKVAHMVTNNVTLVAKDFLSVTLPTFINSGFALQPNFLNASDEAVERWQRLLDSLDECGRVILLSFLATGITRDNLVSLHRGDIYVPVDFILARPWMTYQSSTVVMMKAGRETGEIVVGQQRFQMDTRVADRMLYANYFYYGKALVYKDRNVLVAPNVFIQDYIKGNNTSFVTEADLGEINEHSCLFNRTASILAFMTPANDYKNISNVLDIRGTNTNIEIPEYNSPSDVHYGTCNYYRQLLNIEPHNLSDPMSDYYDYEDMNMNPNSICFLGHTNNYRNEVIYTNTGHLGPHTHDQVNLSRRPGHYAPVHPTPHQTLG